MSNQPKRADKKPFLRLLACLLMLGGTFFIGPVWAATTITVYKSPTCGCCADWVKHLKKNGFAVIVHDTEDMDKIKKTQSVPSDLQSCHTATVKGYTLEGHVPAADIKRLLAEKPEAKGLAVPDMPPGAPGMDQDGRMEPYNVVLFDAQGHETVYAAH